MIEAYYPKVGAVIMFLTSLVILVGFGAYAINKGFQERLLETETISCKVVSEPVSLMC